MFGYGGYTCGGFMIIPLILLGLLIYGIVKLAQGRKKGKDQSNNAVNILEERYVQGDIEEEEYQRKKEFLKNK